MDISGFFMINIDEPVHIESYNDQWPKIFSQEKLRIKQALSQQYLEFEHIGSTAVPGLSAKPIIDIMVGVRNYPPSNELIQQICALGYSCHGEANVPGRLYFTRRDQCNFNLAVVLFEQEHWIKNIKFRDFLRQDPSACSAYERIKSDAINSGATTLLAYSEFKRAFIADILKLL
ncbi:MAG TPA: GrpB family protein [Candidatus Babeliales bacterium]|nr:GrpB family protein [Candidatus Babeliales bacterium]